jgi:hypothetical protein
MSNSISIDRFFLLCENSENECSKITPFLGKNLLPDIFKMDK